MVNFFNKTLVILMSVLLLTPFSLVQALEEIGGESNPYCADGSVLTFPEFIEANEDGLITFQISKNESGHTADLIITNDTGCAAPVSFSSYLLRDDWSLAKQEFFDGSGLTEMGVGTTTIQINLPLNQPTQIDAWYGLHPQTLLNTNPYSFPNVPGVFIWDFAYLCEVEGIVMVSDTNTLLSSGEQAVAAYADNPRWTADIDGATWIWSSHFVSNPENDGEEIFEKKFDLFFVPSEAVLTVAADNSYEVSVNGQSVGSDSSELNYLDENKGSYNITQFLRHGAGDDGKNIITFKVKNHGLASSTPETNPAGLLYKLVIKTANQGSCQIVPPPPPPPSENHAPTIVLNGDNPMEIFVGSNFVDPGATATDTEDGDLTDSIVVTGSVSTSTAGTYTLTYSVSDSDGASVSVMRQVIVKECEDGNICRPNRCGGINGTPVTAPSSFPDVLESHPYYSDIQNAASKCLMVGYVGGNFGPDDNLTEGHVGIVLSRIFYKEFSNLSTTSEESVTKGELISTLANAFEVSDELIKTFVMQGTCLDSSCLNANLTRGEAAGYFVKAFDYFLKKNTCSENTPPVITLNGDNPLNLFVGDIFVEPGYTAIDAQDGDLTASTTISGTVNTATTSTSTLIYSVADSGGLSASTTRTVIVNATTTATTTPPDDGGDDGGGDNGGDGGGGGGGGGSGGIGGHRRVPPLATLASSPALIPTACFYLEDYLRRDWNNDPFEVAKLQSFLNSFEKENLEVNSTFDQPTFEAVERFQNKYFDDILAPWGHDAPTGFVYILTKKKINEIYCNAIYTLTPEQQTEIVNFRNYLNSLRGREIMPDVSGSVGVEIETTSPLVLEDVLENHATNTPSVLLGTLSRIKEYAASTFKFMDGGAAVSFLSMPRNISEVLKYVIEIALILAFTYSISAFIFDRETKDEADRISIKRKKLWFSSVILLAAIAGVSIFSSPRLVFPLGIVFLAVIAMLIFGKKTSKVGESGVVSKGGVIEMPAAGGEKSSNITTIKPESNEKLESQLEKPINLPSNSQEL